MLDISSPEPYVHKLDGVPDERRSRRISTRSLAVRNPVLGRVVYLTEDGLGIECYQPLRVFERYHFTLTLGGSSKLHKVGEVRWSRLTSTGVGTNGQPEFVYRVGISLLDS